MKKRFESILNDLNGKPVSGISVLVKTYPAGAVATIYSDEGITPKANPLTTDALGYYEYYAADGDYSETISGTGITTRIINDILIEDSGGDLAASSGSSLVGFIQSGSGAVAGKVQDALRLFVHTSQYDTISNYRTANNALTGTTGISGVDAGTGGEITNALFGRQALVNNTTGSSNVAFGTDALARNTTGFGNSAFGRDALAFCVSGEDNAAFGRLSLNFSTANGCSAFGANALAANTTGLQNTGLGRGALNANTTGETNTAVGAGALGNHPNGNSNTTCGMDSLALLTSGTENTCLGADALGRIATGSNNVALGKDAGRYTPALAVVTSISNCTFVGYLAKASATTGITNENAFGYLAEGFGSNTLTLGNASVTVVVPGATATTDLGTTARTFRDINISRTLETVNVRRATGGALTLATGGTNSISVQPGDTQQLLVTHTASAVNYLQVTGAITGGSVSVSAQGSDADVGMSFRPKGVSPITFQTNGGGSEAFRVANVASAVNWLQAAGGATGAPGVVTLSAQGSNTNVDLAITPKGTGVLKFGAHTAIGAETVTGFITIKDSGGTSRKLAVVS